MTQTEHYYEGSSDAVVESDAPTHTHAKNITHTQHSPTCCFLCIQGSQYYIVNNPGQQCPLLLYTRRNFLCLQTLSMNLQHSSKCQPFPATPSFPQPCLSQSDTEHQYSLSSNDKLGSLLGILHSDCHNLISLLVVPTQYLNTIFVTILLPCLHPLVDILRSRSPAQSASTKPCMSTTLSNPGLPW
jgi:hypothetical protein